ncbi:hypothetical protein ACTSEZ_01745 [Metabacillus sp. JX24]|uniref:hypothetical protein n=1 Tax=Metabacillus sp. JX24 TaxID=3240759 RepID=UPI00350FD254
MNHTILIPNHIRGRSIHNQVIPTVCNIKNMLNKLIELQGNFNELKQWEKSSHRAYNLEKIQLSIMAASEEERIDLIRKHILSEDPNDLGGCCIDIYLVAYVAETYGTGKKVFFDYVLKNGITEKEGSAQAIWQVGKGDGVYLGILNEDGSIKDWNFIAAWIKGVK